MYRWYVFILYDSVNIYIYRCVCIIYTYRLQGLCAGGLAACSLFWFPQHVCRLPGGHVPAWNTGALCAAVVADKITLN